MSFYVTLPSNASTQQYDNKQSNYTTELDTPINLTGPYEVALVEFCFREYIQIDIGEIIVAVKKERNIYNIIYSVFAYENEHESSFVNRLNNEIIDYLIIHGIYVTTSNIKLDYTKNNTISIKEWWKKYTIDEPVKAERAYLSESVLFSDEKNKTILRQLLILKSNSTVVVAIDSIKAIHNIEMKGLCTNIFGYYKKIIATSTLFFNSSLLNMMDYLMVYTDIVSYQYVGDTFAPLLRTICKTGKVKDTTEKIFINPHYLPVCKSFINSINIDIRDPSGNPVKFANPFSKVLAKLHFRPCIATN